MADNPLRRTVLRMRQALAPGDEVNLTDRQLLERFTREQDETAFAALVERHGPLVLGVCRRLLRTEQDAEDAFQATFLVLARRARAVAWRDGLGGWLHQVAYRVALKARSRRARRQFVESTVEPPAVAREPEATSADLRQVVDEELARLPVKYRTPLVLCFLQGKTHDQAAQELGWPRGSMAKRLKRAQDLLRGRLVGRGVGLGAAGLAALAASDALAAVPVLLSDTTVRTAALFAAGDAAVSNSVTLLTRGVLRTMFLNKLKGGAAVGLLLLSVVAVGAGLFWQPTQAADKGKDEPKAPAVFTMPAETPQLKADRDAVVKGNTEFAFDLYQKLAQDKETAGKNLFVSPYSISTALAMTSTGARGETLDQMSKTLHFPIPADRLPPACASLIGRLQANKKDQGYQLAVANSLWGQQSYPWRPEFLTTTRANYNAGLQEVDFKGATEAARLAINGWVEEKTQDKIKNLLPERSISSATRLVLVNAIYFKGDWLDQFDKKLTREEPFLGTGAEVKAPLMHRTAEYGYMDGDGFQALSLPYKGKELSMVVILPKQADGLAAFEKSLTGERLDGIVKKLAGRQVQVALPKFKMLCNFTLNDPLTQLGMTTPFQYGKADFSGMDDSNELFIGLVVHKAFVEVNEEGTEAAAATAVEMKGGSAAPARPPVFRADHPFLFLIRDNQTGSVLFLGRLAAPGT